MVATAPMELTIPTALLRTIVGKTWNEMNEILALLILWKRFRKMVSFLARCRLLKDESCWQHCAVRDCLLQQVANVNGPERVDATVHQRRIYAFHHHPQLGMNNAK